MATEQSINKLLAFGEQKKWIRYEKIGKLKSSCCTESEIQVIDFDFFKEKYQIDKKLAHLKSCDALKIYQTNIDLIEMKGFETHFTKPEIKSKERKKEKVEKKIEKDFCISDKMKDSLKLWDFFLHENAALDGNEIRDIEKNTSFQIILLTDIEIGSPTWISLNFEFFAEYNSDLDSFLLQKMQYELDGIDQSIIARIKNLPLLKTCTEIDDYYATV